MTIIPGPKGRLYTWGSWGGGGGFSKSGSYHHTGASFLWGAEQGTVKFENGQGYCFEVLGQNMPNCVKSGCHKRWYCRSRSPWPVHDVK